MKIFKTILKLIFCPIWLIVEHNPNDYIVRDKYGFVKYILISLFVASVFVLVYYVWGELL